MTRRVLFLGSPLAAVPILEKIIDAGHDVVGVISQPDAKRGRGATMSPTPVKKWAVEHGISVTDDLSWAEHFASDDVIGVVVAYGRIIPKRILDRVAMINVHFSLLPRWRGAAPVERALLAGDTETGVCIMDVEETLDTGAVYARESTAIELDDTTERLTMRLARMGARLLCEVLGGDMSNPLPQVGEASYAHKVRREETHIDWTMSANQVSRVVRALPAVTMFAGRRLRVLEAEVIEGSVDKPATFTRNGEVSCGEGLLRIGRVQPEGKSAMSCDEWLRGVRSDTVLTFEQVR